ncbi:hypothetical protein ACFYTC_01390 [Actinomadura nitritigenes]|uniref:hypothetical protein n=1 Tax=Actinomadura nitritigenes TaxID=134602 RepID=UPI0036D1FB47
MRRDADGYLHFVDRAKDMVNSRGQNVYCGELERVLAEYSDVLDVAVFGVSDRTWVEAAEGWWRPGAGPARPHWTRAAESA